MNDPRRDDVYNVCEAIRAFASKSSIATRPLFLDFLVRYLNQVLVHSPSGRFGCPYKDNTGDGCIAVVRSLKDPCVREAVWGWLTDVAGRVPEDDSEQQATLSVGIYCCLAEDEVNWEDEREVWIIDKLTALLDAPNTEWVPLDAYWFRSRKLVSDLTGLIEHADEERRSAYRARRAKAARRVRASYSRD